MSLLDLDAGQLATFAAGVREDYDSLQARNLSLDLTRGKPSTEQLDLADKLLELPGKGEHLDATGADVRNYGNPTGVRDLRAIWAELLRADIDKLIAAGNSSLNVMFDLVSWSYTFGNNDSERPWSQEEKITWICPVPGYDRHFTITEKFGFEMINIPMLEDGPDVGAIKELAANPQVKGMWLVPTFSNPTGVTVSEEIARELAELEAAASDFRIVWDNAYAFHTLTDTFPSVHNVLQFAEDAGNPNRFWYLTSTSKITHAGSGVAFFASSPENLAWYQSIAGARGIGPNKVNQLAHARYLGDAEGVRSIMRQHAQILAPKFDRVLEILDNRLSEYEVARWTTPTGGYFISLDVIDGTASRVVELAREAGIALTEAGSSFPYHEDPNNRNIRLAPTLPPVSELTEAMEGVATCVLLAAVEKLGA